MADNRSNEPTEAQVEAAAKAIADCHNPGMFERYPENWRVEARAALEAAARAAQGATPQAESDSVWELIGGALQTPPGDLTGDEYRRQLIKVLEERHGAAPVVPSSGVDEEKLARLLCEKNYLSPDGKPTCAACRDKAHEVAEWLKGQGNAARE